VLLAAQHGVGAVAVGLGLDHARLKAKLAAATEIAQTAAIQPVGPTFVELFSGPATASAPQPSAVGPCVLRIRSPRGVRVRVDLASVGAVDLATLLKELV
jgi:hypothetical protein